jgi:hypothetical protein
MAIYRANSLILRKVIPLAYYFGERHADQVLNFFVFQLNILLSLPLSRLVHR